LLSLHESGQKNWYIYIYKMACKTLKKSLRFEADSFQLFIYFSLIFQRTLKGLDKLTNGTIDNQGVKLPKN